MELKILFFTSPTCSWCSFLIQILERITKEAPHLVLEIIDITKDIEKAEEMEIVAIPTIILPNNQRIIGAADEAFIREQLDFFLIMG
ncbi:MAG: thioredoxin domain-containing protein [Candidatus Heimdallarchaeaceae archaeon]